MVQTRGKERLKGGEEAVVMTHGVNLKGTGGCRERNEALAGVGESTEKCGPERWALRWEVIMDC